MMEKEIFRYGVDIKNTAVQCFFITVDIYKFTHTKNLSILRTTIPKQHSSILSLLKALLGLFHQEIVN